MAAPRMMAMQAMPARQSMTLEDARRLVKPTWSAEMRFPKTVRVIVGVSNTVWGIGSGVREIAIMRPDQELPVFIIQWMSTHPVYRTWFLSGTAPKQEPLTTPAEEKPVPSTSSGTEPELVQADEPEPTDDEPDKPKRQRRKKAADDDGEE